jgi:hypothetical protein
MVAKCLVPGTVGCFDPIDHVIVLLRINHANIVHLLIADERVPGAEFADHDGAKDRLFAAGPGNDLTDPARQTVSRKFWGEGCQVRASSEVAPRTRQWKWGWRVNCCV